MKLKLATILACLLPLLAACSDKEQPLPTLAPVTVAMPIIWSSHLTNATKVDMTKLTPAVDGDTLLVVGAAGEVRAASLNTGHSQWHTTIKGGISGGVAVANGVVYVPANNGQLYAFQESNGHLLWHVALSNQSTTAPVVAGNQIYVKTIDDNLLALNVADGKQLWMYEGGGAQLQFLGSSRVAVSGDTIVAGFSDGRINAIQAKSGDLEWQTAIATPQGFSDIQQMIGITADPVIAGNTVYAASYHGTISALDMHTGRIVWQHPLSDYAGVAVSNNAVFAVGTNGYVWAYSRADGHVLWQQKALAKRRLTGPVVSGDNVVVADNTGNVHWLSQQTGAFTARTNLKGAVINITPLVANNKLIVIGNNGIVYVFKG